MKDQRGPKMTPLFYSALTFFMLNQMISPLTVTSNKEKETQPVTCLELSRHQGDDGGGAVVQADHPALAVVVHHDVRVVRGDQLRHQDAGVTCNKDEI